MLNWLSTMHRANAEIWYEDVVAIEDQTSVDVWETSAEDVPCNVQQERAARSPRDEYEATSREVYGIIVYMDNAVAVEPGSRVIWNGEHWDVLSVTGRDRGHPFYSRLWCEKSQSALFPETVAVRRRRDGQWDEVGSFEFQFMRQLSVYARDLVDGDTADGGSFEADMIGGEDSKDVQVGDWFGRDGFPGRIIGKNDIDADRIIFRYSMEVAVP